MCNRHYIRLRTAKWNLSVCGATMIPFHFIFYLEGRFLISFGCNSCSSFSCMGESSSACSAKRRPRVWKARFCNCQGHGCEMCPVHVQWMSGGCSGACCSITHRTKDQQIGVSVNGGTPKWMVYKFIRENPAKMDDLGVPRFQQTPKSWGHNSKMLQPHQAAICRSVVVSLAHKVCWIATMANCNSATYAEIRFCALRHSISSYCRLISGSIQPWLDNALVNEV